MALHIIDHPLVQHKLSIMRNKATSTMKFRELLKEISLLMGYEVTRDMPIEYEEIPDSAVFHVQRGSCRVCTADNFYPSMDAAKPVCRVLCGP